MNLSGWLVANVGLREDLTEPRSDAIMSMIGPGCTFPHPKLREATPGPCAWEVTVVSDAGGKKGFVYKSRQDTYRALRRKGKTKTAAAAISNAGKTKAGRKRMAKKASRTRRSKR